MSNHLAEVVRLVERIREGSDVPDRYKARLKPRYDSVAGRHFIDMRALLTVRLLRLSKKMPVLKWVSDWKGQMLEEAISEFDRRLLRKLL